MKEEYPELDKKIMYEICDADEETKEFIRDAEKKIIDCYSNLINKEVDDRNHALAMTALCKFMLDLFTYYANEGNINFALGFVEGMDLAKDKMFKSTFGVDIG